MCRCSWRLALGQTGETWSECSASGRVASSSLPPKPTIADSADTPGAQGGLQKHPVAGLGHDPQKKGNAHQKNGVTSEHDHTKGQSQGQPDEFCQQWK